MNSGYGQTEITVKACNSLNAACCAKLRARETNVCMHTKIPQ